MVLTCLGQSRMLPATYLLKMKVKGFCVHPRTLNVVNLELDAGKDPCWRNSREVVAEDLSAGKETSHFDGPDSGPGSDVENMLCIFFIDWGVK